MPMISSCRLSGDSRVCWKGEGVGWEARPEPSKSAAQTAQLALNCHVMDRQVAGDGCINYYYFLTSAVVDCRVSSEARYG